MVRREVWSAESAMAPARSPQLLHSGLRVSVLGAAWTLVASSAGVWAGIAHASLALLAFGVVGILDAAGSATLAVHFRMVRSGHDRAEHAEHVAFHVITAGLVAVGITTGVVSVLQLVHDHEPEQSATGVVIAGVSVVVLGLFATRKRWLALRIPSRALLADSHLSAIGAVLATVTLAGTLANDAFGWPWADPAAALCVALLAFRLGIEMAREDRSLNGR